MISPYKWAQWITGRSVFYITDALTVAEDTIAKAIVEYIHSPGQPAPDIHLTVVTVGGLKFDANEVFIKANAAKKHLSLLKREKKKARRKHVWVLKRFRNFTRSLPLIHPTSYGLPMQFETFQEISTYLRNRPHLLNYTPVKIPITATKKGA